MNSHTVEGNWNVLKGKMRQQWSKLTDNDIDFAKGHYEEIVGRLQKAYGYTEDQAMKEYEKFKNANVSLFSEQPKVPKN